ncbi:hypothetical protein ACFSQQ_11610 [Mesorhizobium kowhaii]|uniref:hypothetical protein n=1 Tax=Mesorhizobium kowhaii TaxID=1300272 RepID=UPI0035EE64B3
MNKGNANRVAIDLGPSMTPAYVRDSPEQELTIAFSLRNRHASHPTLCLTVRADLSQLDPGYGYENNPNELADAAERGGVLPEFRRTFDHAETRVKRCPAMHHINCFASC